MDAAAATAASMAHQDEVATSSTNPDTAVHPGTVPMNVEFPKEAVVPEQEARHLRECQFVDTPGGMEISETDLKCSEFDRKVRRINGFGGMLYGHVWVPAQADYDNPQFLRRRVRKADEESDAVHTHDGEPMKSLEVPISGERHHWSEVWSRIGKVQVARQKEIDSVCKTRGVELVKDERVQTGVVLT